jgi:hypothetical protein
MKKMEKIKDDLFRTLSPDEIVSIRGGLSTDPTLSQHVTNGTEVDSKVDP